MKVGELKALLAGVDDDREVVMSRDSEGNGYSPLAQVDDESTYRADSTWAGEVGPEAITDEMRAQGWTDEDMVGGVPAVVFWPTN